MAEKENADNPVIFLDIDGVLNTTASWWAPDKDQKFAPEAIQALNTLTDTTHAVMVITSTWRKHYSLAELHDILARAGVTGQVVDFTPPGEDRIGVSGDMEYSERGEEIQRWLDENPTRRFAILDDEDDMGDLLHYLIQTDCEVGLTMADAKRCVMLLGGQLHNPGK